jgi:hypothetical protein
MVRERYRILGAQQAMQAVVIVEKSPGDAFRPYACPRRGKRLSTRKMTVLVDSGN